VELAGVVVADLAAEERERGRWKGKPLDSNARDRRHLVEGRRRVECDDGPLSIDDRRGRLATEQSDCRARHQRSGHMVAVSARKRAQLLLEETTLRAMQPEDVRRIREALACSLGELAAAVGVDVKTLLAWESGDQFPTKRHADRLKALEAQGPSAIKRSPKRPATGPDLLADPRFWTVVRKLATHPDLFSKVEQLSATYD
jgi:DNA-binding transcriptional regulator YiaG